MFCLVSSPLYFNCWDVNSLGTFSYFFFFEFIRRDELDFASRYEVVYTHFPEMLYSEEYSKMRGLPHGLDVLQSDTYTINKKCLYKSRHAIFAAKVSMPFPHSSRHSLYLCILRFILCSAMLMTKSVC